MNLFSIIEALNGLHVECTHGRLGFTGTPYVRSMQGPSATNALPPDLNPKVFEAIASSTGIDLGTLKGNESLPATHPTLAVPTRAKPRSAHAAKSSKTARPPSSAPPPKVAAYSPSPSPDYYDGPESPNQASDVAEVCPQALLCMQYECMMVACVHYPQIPTYVTSFEFFNLSCSLSEI